MKKIIAFLLCIITCLCCFSACSFAWDDDTTITSASVVYNEQTKKYYIELVYGDGEKNLIEVGNLDAIRGDTGSAGEKGDKGNGISEILTENKGKFTEVTIKYTDEGVEDTVFTIPNGEYVSSVQLFGADETHEGPYLVFTFSGNTEPKEILLPVPKDGTGIEDITFTDEGKDISCAGTLVIRLTDGTEKKIPVPAATGIASITQDEEDGSYKLIVTYTDGTSETFSFEKPNEWMSGSEAPKASDGKPGDFYFDTYKKIIYKKVGSDWTVVMEFETEQDVTVIFNAEGAVIIDQNVPVGNEVRRTVKYGKYISDVPIPQMTGKTFIGWYRKKQTGVSEGVKPTLGCFTDLTPVTENITLYAWWE